MTEKVYPLIIKMNTKEIQIGSIKVEISSGNAIDRIEQEHDVTISDINLQFKKGDFIAKVKSRW